MNHGALLYSSPKPNIVPPDISATKRSFGADHPRPQTPVRFRVGIRNREQNCCFVRVSGGGGGNRRSGKVYADVKSVDKFEKGLSDVVSGKEDLEVESAAEVSWLQLTRVSETMGHCRFVLFGLASAQHGESKLKA